MSVPDKQVTFKSLRDHEWPAMSKHARKEHERLRCRGWTPEEIVRLKRLDLWEQKVFKGPFVQ